MPATGYSQAFAQELDLHQLLARMRGVSLDSVDPKADVTEVERAWIRADVICTCCSVTGAGVVRAGQNEKGRLVRQGHFRFRSPTDQDAHHPLCEFDGDEGARTAGPERVDFGAARTDLTRAVGELVCRGLERGEFSAEQMQAMRRWYFEAKVQSRFVVVDRPEIFDWLGSLAHQTTLPRSTSLSDDLEAFDPAFGDLPGFNWKKAAVFEVWRNNAAVFARLGGASRSAVTTATKLAKRHDGQEEFDRSALEAPYKAALELAQFMGIHGDVLGAGDVRKFATHGAPPALLALAALLLHRTGQDRLAAARLFARLTQGPAATDTRRGNVIGLNPFHEFDAWRVVKLAAELAQEPGRSFSQFRDVQSAEARLKAEHAAWRTDGQA